MRFGAPWDRRAAAAEILLGSRAVDRSRAELEAAIAFGCGGAIPSPRGWLAPVREALDAM